MPSFAFDEFDPYVTAEPRRPRLAGASSLCAGYKHAHLYRRRNQAEPAVYCHELGKYVPPDIVECSQFTGIAAMSLHEMQRLALPIDARPGPSDGGYR